MDETLLRLPNVIARVGLGRTAIYDAVRAGSFPAPIRLTATAVAWRRTEIDAWIAARIEASSKQRKAA